MLQANVCRTLPPHRRMQLRPNSYGCLRGECGYRSKGTEMSVLDPKRTSAPKTPTCYMCCLAAEPIRQNDPQTSMVRSGKDGVVKSALNRREFNGLCGALGSFVASSGALARCCDCRRFKRHSPDC